MKSIKRYTQWLNQINEQTEPTDILQSIKDLVVADPQLSDPKFLSSVSSNLAPLSPEEITNLTSQVSKIKDFSNSYPEGADFLVGESTFKGVSTVTPQQFKSLLPSEGSQFVRFIIEDSGYLQYEGNIQPVVALTANRAKEDPIKGTYVEFEKGKVKWLFTFGPRFTSVYKVMAGQTPQFVLKADNSQMQSISKSQSGNMGILHDMSKDAQNYLAFFPKKAKEGTTEEEKIKPRFAEPTLKRK